MKFSEAMEELKKGKKVTRHSWINQIYFKLDGSDVRTYQPRSSTYTYNEDIMISEGWIVDGVDGEFKFYEIIDHLRKGKKAWLKNWGEMSIHFDLASQSLVIDSMEAYPFLPSFDSFIAEDWVVIS